MQKIKAVIFDLGKVVFDLSEDLIAQSWSASSGRPIIDFRSDSRFTALSDRFEKAGISAARFRKGVLEILGIDLGDEAFDRGWCSLYREPYPKTRELLAGIRRSHKIVALTNTNVIHAAVWKEKYRDVLDCFERVFSSHEIKARKPEKNAFATVLKYLQLEPGETLFLDDSPVHVAGAGKLGMRTILVKSRAQMVADLKRIGIKGNGEK